MAEFFQTFQTMLAFSVLEGIDSFADAADGFALHEQDAAEDDKHNGVYKQKQQIELVEITAFRQEESDFTCRKRSKQQDEPTERAMLRLFFAQRLFAEFYELFPSFLFCHLSCYMREPPCCLCVSYCSSCACQCPRKRQKT